MYRIFTILLIYLCIGIPSFGIQEKAIRISAISIQWNENTQEFDTYFSVNNNTRRDVKLTSIIIFKIGKSKRWRGTRLPVIKANTTRYFKVSNSAGILLKNDYISITVNIYGKNYVGFIDRSSKYKKIKSKRIIGNGKIQIAFTEIRQPTEKVRFKPVKRLVQLGPEEDLRKLMATEKFQNSALAPVPLEATPFVKRKKQTPKPPAAPVVSVKAEKQSIVINWSPVKNATRYHIFWGTSPGVTRKNGEMISNVRSGFRHDQLQQGISYYYVVTAEKGGLESPVSKEVSAVPVFPPRAPEGLKLLAGDARVMINWDPVENAESYHVYWRKSEDTDRDKYNRIKDVQSGFEHTDLQNGITYFYYITAANKAGESTESQLISSTPQFPFPEPPKQLSAKAEKKRIVISWQPDETMERYHLYWSNTPGVTKDNGTKIPDISRDFQHDQLEFDLPYYYVITAERAGQESKESKEISATPLILPGAPVGIKLEVGDSRITVRWETVKKATAYNLYWSTKADAAKNEYKKISGVESGFEHVDLQNDLSYYYYITAENASGESIESNLTSAAPRLPPPESPQLIVQAGDSKVRIDWEQVPGAISYNLYWGKSLGVNKTNGEKISSLKEALELKDLQNGSIYYYVLTAVNLSGESEESTEVSAIPQIPPPPPPTLTYKTGDSKVALNWTDIPTATSYNLYWSSSPNVNETNGKKIIDVKSGFEHTGLQNSTSYHYVISAINAGGEGRISEEIVAMPKIPAAVETPVPELVEGVFLDDFRQISPDPKLLLTVGDSKAAKEESLKRAKDLEALDISSREKLIALYIAEGKTKSITDVLSNQHSKEPENLNLSLSLSKVYHEQGNIKAALKILNSSLNRISLSARVALNQELKVSVKKGASTLTKKSEQTYLADEFSKLGISLLERQKYLDALSAFQSLYSLVQDYPMVKFYLGKSRQGMKQYNQAGQLFEQQSQEDINKNQLLDDLRSLVEIAGVTLSIPTIQSTKKQYQDLLQQENTAEQQKDINQNIAVLDKLYAEAERKRIAGLSDLGIALAGKFELRDIQPGQDIYFDLIATNYGKKDSQEFKVYYQMKHEQGIVYDIQTTDRFKAIKANQKSLAWNKKIVVPEEALPGNYSLIANVEQTGEISEVTLENNRLVSKQPINVIPAIADLKIGYSKLLEKKAINPLDEMTVEFTATNQGFKESPEFSVRYSLQHEDNTRVDLGLVDKFKSIAKGGASLNWNKKITVPANLKKGTYRLIASLEPAIRNLEKNAENNQVLSDLNLFYTPPFTDLAINFDQEIQKQTILAGKPITGRLALRNYGNVGSSSLVIGYQLKNEDGSVFSLPDVDQFESIKSDKQPVVFEKTLLIPRDVPRGQYQLVAMLQMDETELDSNRQNDQTVSDYALQIVPSYSDIEIVFSEQLKKQKIQSPGEIEVDLLVRNKGNFDSGSILVTYSLKNEQGETVTLQKDDQFDTVAADNKAFVWNSKIEIPDRLRSGNYQLVAVAKMQNEKYEKNLNNNRAESPKDLMFLSPLTDLAISFAESVKPQTILTGKTITGSLKVDNYGNTNSLGFKVKYWLKSEEGETFALPDSDTFNPIDPDKEPVSWQKSLQIPRRTPPGKYQLLAGLELSDQEPDQRKVNNQIVSDLVLELIPSYSDLEIVFGGGMLSQDIMMPGEMDVEILLNNKGDGESSPFEIAYALRNDQGRFIQLPEKDRFEGLQAGTEGISRKKKIRLPENLRAGQYQLIASLVLDESEFEKNETNNRIESATDLLNLQAPPLEITSVSPVEGPDVIPLDSEFKIEFSSAIDEKTITARSFSIKRGDKTVKGKRIVSQNQVSFKPTNTLRYNTLYTLVVTGETEGNLGERLKKTREWQFKTESYPEGPDDNIEISSSSHDPVSYVSEKDGILRVDISTSNPIMQLLVNNRPVDIPVNNKAKINLRYAIKEEAAAARYRITVFTEKGRAQETFTINYGDKPESEGISVKTGAKISTIILTILSIL